MRANNTKALEAATRSSWLHRLRLLVSVVLGLLTVTLCELWVPSYWYVDSLLLPFTNSGNILGDVDGRCF